MERSPWVIGSALHTTTVLRRGKQRETRQLHGEEGVKMEAEGGVMQPQAKECPGLLEAK